ncbi:hypothetical protein EMPG_14734 [Blastomyces silverae]|uniref:Uncharacterized protein n=1 Tax=Blastomyces silverae TaxID=2060906 RepID=A0A0H1BL23_9EURO|nr:hypothetical protein EMPG_14734 [Blastomyces silverae]
MNGMRNIRMATGEEAKRGGVVAVGRGQNGSERALRRAERRTREFVVGDGEAMEDKDEDEDKDGDKDGDGGSRMAVVFDADSRKGRERVIITIIMNISGQSR